MRTYLEHGLLVFTVLHLSCGQVEDATLHGVLVTVVDEDIGPTHHHKVLHPRVGARLHEAQETLLGHHRSGKRRRHCDLSRGAQAAQEVKANQVVSASIRKQKPDFSIFEV